MERMMELDDAFANAAYIPGGADYPERWLADARAFRSAHATALDVPYAESERSAFDLFQPEGTPRGVVIFVHGGYWLRFDRKYWSHFAKGALEHGWAVAMPSYDLCPKVRISEIVEQVKRAIGVIADQVSGPIRLVGHSAGGQLVARMIASDIVEPWVSRIAKVVPISPVADLAPLMLTSMNADLRIDAEEAAAQSPVNLGKHDVPVTVWVGADERPVFVEQAKRLATEWNAALVVEQGRHHFDVIDGLADPQSALMRALLD